MKLRKLTLQLAEEGHPAHTETYVEGERGSFPIGHPDPRKWGSEMVDRFNQTLRSIERPRSILISDLEELPESVKTAQAHNWLKTNLITIEERGRYFDTARCTGCGITGKRFGLGDITPDPLYKGKTFENCNTAKAYIDKRRALGDDRR